MTGSGKTGLCLSLLEKPPSTAYRHLYDPKGDPQSRLTFPNLAPSDFEPCDAGRGRAQRREWRNSRRSGRVLESRSRRVGPDSRSIGKLRAAADVAIYTPVQKPTAAVGTRSATSPEWPMPARRATRRRGLSGLLSCSASKRTPSVAREDPARQYSRRLAAGLST